MDLRPQPEPNERDPEVLRRYIRELHTELTVAGSSPPRSQPDDGERDPKVLHDYIGLLHEHLTEVYVERSGKRSHTRECPISQGYVYRPGPCNCDAIEIEPDETQIGESAAARKLVAVVLTDTRK